jgi:hypothetical protein
MSTAQLILLYSIVYQHFLEVKDRTVQIVIATSLIAIRGFISTLCPLSPFPQIPTPSGPLPNSNQD